MPKLLEELLGPYEYVFLGLLVLGVLYLVWKAAGLSLSKDGMQVQTAGVVGYNTVDDAGNRAGYYPSRHGREGMSMGAYEQPVWHATPYDPNMLDQQANVKLEVLDADAPAAAVAPATESEGMKRGYSKAAMTRQGMLDKALAGGNASLA